MNDKLKILLVSNGFFPEISPRSYRATELAKEFVRSGHQVKVLTKYRDDDYTDFLCKYPLEFKMWSKDKLPKIPDSGHALFNRFLSAINRLPQLLIEYPAIEQMFKVKNLLRKESGYDLMISFAVPYPVHWGVAWSRSQRHKIALKWIADCGDPYMGDVIDTFRKPFYFKYLEKWFSRKCDFITIPVESARIAYYEEFHHKIKIIPQGFDFDIKKVERQQHVINEIPQFAYAGGFIKGTRDPELLLKCLVSSRNDFKFFIYTNNKELLLPFADALGPKLIISGYLPREELLKKLMRMDFLINFDNNTLLNVPSKLIDYSITGRPVLNIRKEFDCEYIYQFLSGDYTNQMLLPAAENYHISNISRKFLDLLKVVDNVS